MSLTFENLGEKLAPGAIEFVGNNQLKINVTQTTGDNELTPQSSLVEPIAKLLQGLAELTTQINEDRANNNPPLPPITFASQSLTGTPSQPKYLFTVEIAVDTSQFSSNLVDPTETE